MPSESNLGEANRAKSKDESFDSLCSNGSRVVQLQVAPRGLRTAKVVKVESEASTAPAAISRR